MQSNDQIYGVINQLYKIAGSPEGSARAILLAVQLLVDIRDQNARIIELLQKSR
jgi:hypothetical protein